MRCAPILSAVLVATAALLSLPAQARERYLVIPEEIGIGPPPALYHGRAYRPHYRYSAYRAVPRTYLCSD